MTPDATERADFDQAIEAAVEAGMREFVQGDGASLRREGDSELVAKCAVMLVQRIGGTSCRRSTASLLSCRPCAHYFKRRESASSASLPNMRICANRPHSRRRSSLTASSNGSPHKRTPHWRLEVHCRPFCAELNLHRFEVHCRPFRTELILCLRVHPQMKEGGAPGAGRGNKKRPPQECQIGS